MVDCAVSPSLEDHALPRVVVVDDPGATSVAARKFAQALREEGYEVAIAAGAADCLRRLADSPSVVILTSLRPGMGWTELCRQIHAVADVPILMGVRLDSEIDAVLAFELGISGYLSHPDRTKELIARVRAALRPVTPVEDKPPEQVRSDSSGAYADRRLEIDVVGRVVKVNGRAVYLARREFDLLAALISQPRQVRTREQLIGTVWGRRKVANSRTLDTHISRLRMKLEPDPTNPRMLITVRGVGFYFEPLDRLEHAHS
jgi:two-component system, OmpR family, response regulator RegX3